jgi:hypothetical protein
VTEKNYCGVGERYSQTEKKRKETGKARMCPVFIHKAPTTTKSVLFSSVKER